MAGKIATVKKTGRRQAHRMVVNGMAYVNLTPDNGGIILNISEGGLCFQSTAPVEHTETIRFWFSYRNRRPDAAMGETWKDEVPTRSGARFIEAESELAWTDETKKMGGIRFTSLPPGAREQIREWMRQPMLVNVNGTTRRLFPLAKRSRANVLAEARARAEVLFGKIQAARIWKGFSGGLVTGVIVSALIGGVFVMVSHRRELGDSLVQLGEQLGGRSWSQTVPQRAVAEPSQVPSLASVSTAPANMSSPEANAVAEQPKAKMAEPIAPPRIEKKEKVAATVPPTVAAKPHGIQADNAAKSTAHAAAAAKAGDAPREYATVERSAATGNSVAPPPAVTANVNKTAVPEVAPPSRSSSNIASSNAGEIVMRSEKYLEVGRFKEKLLADKETGQLSGKGFPATVVERPRFLGKSYQVLVGPYGSEGEAETVHKDLAAIGFTPRSYERGKRDFHLSAGLKVGSKRLPVGDCVVSWESYIPDAIVKMEDEKGVGVTVEGKWVKRDVKYALNSIAYQRNGDGSRTLLEIRFAGMSQALVFDGGSK